MPRDDDPARAKPTDDQMQAGGPEDLVGEVAALAADPHSDDAEIMGRLEVLASNFSVEEIFAVMVRYDTPDLLG